MLRARDFDHVPSDLGTQKRRLRRQRMIEMAIPCAIVAALLVAAVFTVGHIGANAREAERSHMRAQMLLASEHSTVQLGDSHAVPAMPVVGSTNEQQSEQPLRNEAAQHADAADARETAEGRQARAGAKRVAAQAQALNPPISES